MIVTLKKLLEMSLWDNAPKIGNTDVTDPMRFYHHAEKMLNTRYVEADEILKRLRKVSWKLIYEDESNADLADDLQTLIIELEGKQ